MRERLTHQNLDIQSTMGARMGKLAIGCALSLVIGAVCRWVDIPLPSPPKIQGALLVVAMTLGYLATDWVISRKIPSRGSATTQSLFVGPTEISCAPKQTQEP